VLGSWVVYRLSSVEVLAALAVGTNWGLLGLLIAIPLAGCLKNSLDSWQPTTDNSTSTVKAATQPDGR